MKKIFVIILFLFGFFLINFDKVNALSITDFTPALDKKVAKFETTQEKVEWLQSFSDLLNSPAFIQDKNAPLFAEIRKYSMSMLTVFQHELWEEQAKNSSLGSSITVNNTQTTPKINGLPHISDNFSNIDVQKVRNAILSWHNYERQSLGRNAYAYNLDLEGTATVWANKLANSHKTSNLHLRNPGDGYYNYNSMLDRFSGLGVKFPKSINGGASFSETIGYNTYRCSKSDCTDDLITAIKKTWTGLILNEKASNGSHYKAATMKYFTQMGVGIAIDKSNNRYYIVIHYGVKF